MDMLVEINYCLPFPMFSQPEMECSPIDYELPATYMLG